MSKLFVVSNKNQNLDQIFLKEIFSDVSPETKTILKTFQNNFAFYINSYDSIIKKNIFEDSNHLIILLGYVLHDHINYNSNIAKQIFELYKSKQKESLRELGGVFTIVIFQKDIQKLIILNDRLGMKPMYYYDDWDKFILSSDIKLISKSNLINKQINWQAWGDIFNYGFIIGDRTQFMDVLSLPMSSLLTFENGRLEIGQYWSFNQIKVDYKRSKKEFIEIGVEILKNISKKYEKLIDNQILLPLSGGYDSRCIACSLKYFSNLNFTTITSNLHGTGKRDAQIAKELATNLKVEHRIISDNNLYKKYFVDMVYLVNGMTFAHLWAMSLNNKIPNNISLFSGITADVILRLKSRVIKSELKRKKYNDGLLVKYFINDIITISNNLKNLFSIKIKEELEVDEESFLKQIKEIKEYYHKLSFLFLNNRTRNSLLIGTKNILGQSKKAYLFFSDNDFIDFCLKIPPKYKIKEDIYLEILKKAFTQTMSIPTTNHLSFIKSLKKKIINSFKSLLIDKNFINFFSLIGLDLRRYRKFGFLNKFSALPLNNEEDEKYLLDLIDNLNYPKELSKDLVFEQIKNNKFYGMRTDCILVQIANFLVWYNLFILNKSLEEIKSIRKS